MLLLLFLGLSAHRALAQTAPPPCTDCWCVPRSGPEGPCPNLKDREELYKDPSALGQAIFGFSSYLQPTNADAPSLSDPNCQPYAEFAEAVSQDPCEPLNNLAFPQTEIAVCAFKYDNDCPLRTSYEMQTYKSKAFAAQDDAVVIHKGPCGVCSNAEDLAINLNPALDQQAVQCSLAFATGVSAEIFALVKQCFVSVIGFTPDCAQVWASNALSTFFGCAVECLEAIGPPPLPPNDPETCVLNSCLACDEEKSGPIFKHYSGLTRRAAGIINPVLRHPCKAIANIKQDPCAES